MKVGNLLNSRPSYYDRNPLERAKNFDLLNSAPTASTLRLTYTVPANRKFSLEFVQAMYQRMTAAAPAGDGFIHNIINYFSTDQSYIGRILFNNNTVGVRVDIVSSANAIMVAGTNMQTFTQDLSTGGTTSSFLTYKGSEFDA